MAGRKRGPYKQYLYKDDVHLPKSTRYMNLAAEENLQDNVEPVNPPHVNQPHEHSVIQDEQQTDNTSESDGESDDSVITDCDGNDSDINNPHDEDSNSSENSYLTDIDIDIENEDEENIQVDHSFIEGGNDLIHENSSVTKNQSLLLLMAFVEKHNLTNDALDDFLKIMNIHMPQVVPDTKYLFYKKFTHSQFEKHYYCSCCTHYYGPYSENLDECECLPSKPFAYAKQQGWFFLYWPLKSQLLLLLQDRHIRHQLLNRPNNETNDTISDVVDGKVFKKLREVHHYGNPLHNGNSYISLLWNIDGVPVFRSSNKQLWPIQCTINELPFHTRKKHILMPALWFSDSKVITRALMTPFIAELDDLSNNGFMFNGIMIKVFAPICTADSLARPKVKCTKQFNGHYGCDWCLHPGQEVERGKGVSRVYPYVGPQIERTSTQITENGNEAFQTGNAVHGVTGLSSLVQLQYFDLANGFVPDYLHCVLLGVVRQYVNLWFNSSNHNNEYYIGQPLNQAAFDRILKCVKVPKEVRRMPRSISAREHWKGNEYKTFLLFYSLLALKDLLPQIYLKHWFSLVWAIHKLLQKELSSNDITRVEAVLNHFIVKSEELYGLENCTFNIHQLSHLAKSVKMCGPIWSVSTFLFEGNNACLKNMVKGTQFVTSQICQSYCILRTLPLYASQNVSNDPIVNSLFQKLIFAESKTQNSKQVTDGVTCFGKSVFRYFTVEELIAVREIFPVVNKFVCEYKRFVIDSVLFDTIKYTRSVRRQNCYVKVRKCQNDNVEIFRCCLLGLLVVKLCECDIVYHDECIHKTDIVLLCEPLFSVREFIRNDELGISSDFIVQVTQSERVLAIKSKSIITKCVMCEKNESKYLIDMPNLIELE